jgi:hypothetical protein
MRLARTFMLDQVRSRTYPATTRYLATLERYDQDPEETAFRNIRSNEKRFLLVERNDKEPNVH